MFEGMSMHNREITDSTNRESYPPECAGVYTIYDENDIFRCYRTAVLNLRNAYKKEKKNGNIPNGGRFDYEPVRTGFTYDQLSYDDRNRVNKYNPPLIQHTEYDYSKDILSLFPSLEKYIPQIDLNNKTMLSEAAYDHKRHFFYVILGYEKIDTNKEVYYLKEPKALFFMITELIVKSLLAITTILAILGIYFRIAIGGILNQYILLGMVAFPIMCYLLFHYVRRNMIFKIISFINILASAILYLLTYPILQNWPFI